MSRHIFIAVISASLLTLSACATAPNPEKVCTADWIGKRSTKAVSNIERKAKPALTKLGKAAKLWTQGKKPNFVQMLSLNSSIKSLTRELETGRGMRDLKTLSKTCNDPKIVTSAITKMMKENGLSQNMIEFVEKLPQYKNIILKDLAEIRGEPVAYLVFPEQETPYQSVQEASF